MQKMAVVGLMIVCVASLDVFAQVQRTSIPLGDAIGKALKKSVLTSDGGRAFHLRIVVSEPENPESPYQGVIEEWWISPQQWRREVTAPGGVKQTVVMSDGKKSEEDVGDYMPLWLRRFVWAAFDPVPSSSAWSASGMMIEQITMPNGAKSEACARSKSKLGAGPNALDIFSNICFDDLGRLQFFGSPRYDMEFSNYRSFGKKDFPRRFVDHPEPGTELVGSVALLEGLTNDSSATTNFLPLERNDDKFETTYVTSAVMDQLSAGHPALVWPPVSSGRVVGHHAVYVSVDRNGKVREVWPLNSDNIGVDGAARDQVGGWTLKAATTPEGKQVQVDGPLSLPFETKLGTPLPELSDGEVRALAIVLIEPTWPKDGLKHGEIVEVQVSVSEAGELTGTGFGKVPLAAQGAVLNIVQQWRFHPLMRDGKAQYFHGVVRFIVP